MSRYTVGAALAAALLWQSPVAQAGHGHGGGHGGGGHGGGAHSSGGRAGYADAPPAAGPAVDQPPGGGLDKALDFAQLGEEAFNAGQYGMAVRSWRHALVDTPRNGGLVLLLTQALFQTGNYNEAAGAAQ